MTALIIENNFQGAVHAALPPIGGPLPATGTWTTNTAGLRIRRLTDFNQVEIWRAKLPLAVPENAGIGTEHIIRTLYKFPALSPDNKYLMATLSNGHCGLWETADCSFKGLIPMTHWNPVIENHEPRWSRSHPGLITNRNWDGTAMTRTKLPDAGLSPGIGYWPMPGLISTGGGDGGEGDEDWSGRYRAIKRTEGGKIFCGVLDMQASEFLRGWIEGNPNALDISPSGQYLAVLEHEGPNRFYRIADLARDKTDKPIILGSSVVNGVRSIGHNGWGINSFGNEFLVFQDNRDDFMKIGSPITGMCSPIFNMNDWPWNWNHHIASIKNPIFKGWALLGSYAMANGCLLMDNQLALVELKQGGRLIRFGSTEQEWDGRYESETIPSISDDGRYIIWSSCWNGTDINVFQMDISDVWAQLNSPAPPPARTVEERLKVCETSIYWMDKRLKKLEAKP